MPPVELPFLYHTRTILRRTRVPCLPPLSHDSLLRFSTSSRWNAEVAEEDAVRPSTSFLSQKAQKAARTSKKSRPTSTITRDEHKVFQNLLRKIPGKKETQSRIAEIDTNHKNILRLFASSGSRYQVEKDEDADTRSRPDSLELDVTNRTSRGLRRPLTSISTIEERLLRSEETLHDAFEHIITLVTKTKMDQIGTAFHHASRSRHAEAVLWQTCQQLVFPMAKHLTPTLNQGKAPKALQSKSRSYTPVAQPGITTPAQELQLPAHIQPLRIISQLYPAALLLLLRIYVKHYPTSPYALAILPQVRSLGLQSYVLGANIHFYNMLIQLKWDVYSDLKGISDLLTEIEKGGLEPDVTTYNIIKDIGDEQLTDYHGNALGEKRRGPHWWSRPVQVKYSQDVCREWKRRIAGRLQELGAETMAAEREHGDTLPRELDDDGQKEAVWI